MGSGQSQTSDRQSEAALEANIYCIPIRRRICVTVNIIVNLLPVSARQSEAALATPRFIPPIVDPLNSVTFTLTNQKPYN